MAGGFARPGVPAPAGHPGSGIDPAFNDVKALTRGCVVR
jgi:hypothetical protein